VNEFVMFSKISSWTSS